MDVINIRSHAGSRETMKADTAKRCGRKAKSATPECHNFKRCGRKAKSCRARFCLSCFKENAAAHGRLSAGNAKGNPGNAGNNISGWKKQAAGERSGVKRCAKFALVVKQHWLDKIFAGEKDWEIRGCPSLRRGWIHLAQSKAGGTLVGRARLVDCAELNKSTFLEHVHRHCVPRLSMVPYKRIFAWVLEDAERFAQPLAYKHRQGAVIWATAWGRSKMLRNEKKKFADPKVRIHQTVSTNRLPITILCITCTLPPTQVKR